MRTPLLGIVLLLGQPTPTTDIYKYIDDDDPNKEGKSNDDGELETAEFIITEEMRELEAEIEEELNGVNGQCPHPFDDPFLGIQQASYTLSLITDYVVLKNPSEYSGLSRFVDINAVRNISQYFRDY